VQPVLQLLYPIPGLAWVPLAILWLGIGVESIIFVIFFSSIWPLLFNTQAGIASINPVYRRAAMALGTSRWRTFTRVIIPAALPFVLSGLRLTYGTSWRVIVGAEILSARSGLGFMIDNARGLLRGEEVIAGMITIAILGYVFEKIAFDFLERATIRKWGMSL
jgi:ABC-type nitrate/sulfonate/bicarbonate transport system permease component